MTEAESRELKVKEKQEVSTNAEQNPPGCSFYTRCGHF